MIVVDTSVWGAALRGREDSPAETLTSLLDADEVALALPVRVELSAGIARTGRAALKSGLTALPVVVPTEATWELVEEWGVRSADAGQRFAMADLLIAALADEIGALVWSLDADFNRLSGLGFVRLYG